MTNLLQTGFRRCRRKVRLLIDRIWDRYYGIDTAITGVLPQASETSRFGDASVNGPVSYCLLRGYLWQVPLQPDDVFFDVGCGDGRVLCFFARRRVAKCVGIELSAEFAAKAKRNAASLRRKLAPIEIRVGDATAMDYHDGTVFYFGEPFGTQTMREVLHRIGEAVKLQRRHVCCIFVLRREGHSKMEEVIRHCGWLAIAGRRAFPFSSMMAEYWVFNP